jgi:CBS domain-containing protein/PII-like signaling protein
MTGLPGRAKKVTIVVGQPHGERGQAHLKIMERLKAEGAAGATAFKGIAAFGARDHIQTLRLSEIAPELPVMILWIDTPERVERILPHIQSMVAEGIIAVEETDVTLYTTTMLPDLPASVPLREVMTRDVVTVGPDTPVQEVVEDLMRRRLRSVPVVAAGKPVGIITNGDLVRRGGLPVRLELFNTFDTPQVHDILARLTEAHREAGEIMTSPVVTAPEDMDVRHAAALMARRKLKRVPVVDGDGRLVGIASRADLLRALAGSRAPGGDEASHVSADGGQPIRTIMSEEVPIVAEDSSLPAVVDAVLSTRLNRAVVVDAENRVVGVITDSELVERLAPEARPGILRSLMERMPFVHSGVKGEERHAHGNHARDLMLTDIVVAREDEPIRDVLSAMLRGNRKIVPVVDGDGRLLGAVDRADLLSVLATP